jgi:hypothetical protein
MLSALERKNMTKEQKKIEQIRQKLLKLGPMLPGSISEQWNVCGTPGCKCKSRKKPTKHGPYYQLSFSVKGKSSSFFVKKQDLAEAYRFIKRYKQFKKLNLELTKAYVDLVRKNGFTRR